MSFELPPLIYNLCFLTRRDQVLMLHRNKPPNRGLWNGVGGHIDPGESPLDSVLREVAEETGYNLPSARFCGLLTWEGYEIPAAGLYIYTAPAPDDEPHLTHEGTLAWKQQSWIFTSSEVPSNIHYFGPLALGGAVPQVYHFVYRSGLIRRHEVRPLPEGLHL
jgi:8-oxo-dGTP diphosphatase